MADRRAEHAVADRGARRTQEPTVYRYMLATSWDEALLTDAVGVQPSRILARSPATTTEVVARLRRRSDLSMGT